MERQEREDPFAFLQSIVDTVRESMLVLDGRLRVVSASRSFYETFRVTPEETEGRLVYELGSGQWNIPALRRLLEEILPTSNLFNGFEVRHDFPGIGQRTMLLNARKMYRPDSPGDPMILLAIEDATDRTRQGEALRRSEEELRLVVDGAKDYAIFGLDTAGNVETWNDGASRIKQYTAQEIIGRPLRVLYPEDTTLSNGSAEEHLETAAREGRYEGEGWRRRKDGTLFRAHVVLRSVYDLAGHLRGYSKVVRDVSEGQWAEEALRYQSRLTKTITDNAASCLFMMDERGHPTFMNPAAEVVTGYTLDEIKDRPLHYAVHHTHPDGTPFPMEECPIDRSSATLVPIQGHEDIFVRKDGTFFPVSCSVAPLEREGKTVGAVLEFRDITEEKRAAAALEARIGQQGAVAQLGLRALSGTDLSAVMDEAVALVARALDVELCKVLQLLPAGNEVLLIAGVGWKDGLVGHGRVSTGRESQAGYTLISQEPVIVEDLRTETRFSGPPLLHEHGVVSGISCIIHGRGGQPFGVLGAHTRKRRLFTRDDTNFLQGIAHVLATAIERKRGEEEKADLLAQVAQAAAQQRTFLRDVLASVTEGKLRLCDSPEDLPPRLAPATEPIELTAGTLRGLRQRTLEAAREQNFDKDRGYDLITAVSEAGMNAIRHAGGGAAQVGAYPSGAVQVWIEDEGTGIDMSRLPQATLERGFSSAGTLGHGFWLMLNTIDRLYLLTGPRGTTVVIEQERIAPEPAWFAGR